MSGAAHHLLPAEEPPPSRESGGLRFESLQNPLWPLNQLWGGARFTERPVSATQLEQQALRQEQEVREAMLRLLDKGGAQHAGQRLCDGPSGRCFVAQSNYWYPVSFFLGGKPLVLEEEIGGQPAEVLRYDECTSQSLEPAGLGKGS